MIIRLQHQRSDGEKDTYHLKSGRRYHLGRGSACEVRILDLKLSRKHCAIEYLEGEWRVIDLASTNGCKVDGDQIVGSVPLKVGSQIEIGQSTIGVTRILGDDELDEEDEDTLGTVAPTPVPGADRAEPSLESLIAPVTPMPTPAPRPSAPAPPPFKPEVKGPPAPSKLKTPEPPRYEPEPMDDEPSPPPKPKPKVEHSESDWEPLPEQDPMTKVGALTPLPMKSMPAAGTRPTPVPAAPPTPGALEAARRAAANVAQQVQGSTGAIQKPGSLGRDQARQPQPINLDSGGYKTLDLPEIEDPSPVLPKEPTPPRPLKVVPTAPPAAEAPRTDARSEAKPGTETRRRQKIQPVVIQPIQPQDTDDVATHLPASRPAPPAPPRPPLPTTPSAPPRAATIPTPMPAASPAPAPVSPVPLAASADGAAKPEAERTFFISVLGRRVGPLTRAAARDLKARELKGTLTVKDLDQYT